jgi:hypothetical protein
MPVCERCADYIEFLGRSGIISVTMHRYFVSINAIVLLLVQKASELINCGSERTPSPGFDDHRDCPGGRG